MTTNKDFKRLVRARMSKTGEAYTTARAHLTKSRNTSKPAAAPASIDYATLAGMSDHTLKEKTGCTWERWVHALDYHGADGEGTEVPVRGSDCAARNCKSMFQNGTRWTTGILKTARDFTQLINLTAWPTKG